jgi:hypothetical protein
VAPNLNERISEKVWAESLTQARQMADFLVRKPAGIADDTINSLRAVAINVLGRVGYDQPKAFRPMELPSEPDAPMTYVEAISLCTELLVLVALLPGWLLRLPFLPKPVRTVGAAMGKLPALTEEMLEEERRIAADTDTARDNVMSMLVRLSDQGKAEDRLGKAAGAGGGGGAGQFLTEDEIAGNLFVFTGAGFDTTATTLTYSVALLAIYPEWQAWIQEEIDFVLDAASKEKDGDVAFDYSTCFPKLNRCLALMVRLLSRASRHLPAYICKTLTYPLLPSSKRCGTSRPSSICPAASPARKPSPSAAAPTPSPAPAPSTSTTRACTTTAPPGAPTPSSSAPRAGSYPAPSSAPTPS